MLNVIFSVILSDINFFLDNTPKSSALILALIASLAGIVLNLLSVPFF